MPLYEYKCESCKLKFEEVSVQSKSAEEDKGELCPQCKTLSKRVAFSKTSNPVFMGSGFYETDYRKKS